MDEKKRIGIAIAVLVLIAGGTAFWFRNPVVAKAGDYEIRRRDVAYQSKIEEALPGRREVSEPRDTLVRAFVQAQVLKENGFDLSEEAVRREAARITSSLKPGTSLERVRALFGKDEESYRRLVVLPMLVERLKYEEMLNRAPVFEEAKKRAEELVAASRKDPKNFRKVASRKGLTVLDATLTRKDGFVWDSEKKRTPQDSSIPQPFDAAPSLVVQKDREYWFGKAIGGLKDGEVRPEPLEYGRAWLVLKVVSHAKKGPESYKLEGVRVPMGDAHVWFRGLTDKVKVELF